MDTVSKDLGLAAVFDIEGREHALEETWHDRATVLIFLRHFA